MAFSEVNKDPLDIPEAPELSGFSSSHIKRFRVDFSGYGDLIRQCYLKYLSSSYYFDRFVTPAMFEYYCTVALWVRIYRIKRYNSDVSLLQDVSYLLNLELVLPKPIYTYLSGLGEIVDLRGVRYKLDVPVPSDSPHWLQFGGAFGQLGPETIQHYVANASTFPSMYRMFCEVAPDKWIENHLHYDLPGDFYLENLHPNRNMFGYDLLHNLRADAKRMLRGCGITSTASDPHQQFIEPNDNAIPCIGGVLVNIEVIFTVRDQIRSVRELPVMPEVPKNRTGSLAQVGFVQWTSSNDYSRPLEKSKIPLNFRLTEQEIRGCSAQKFKVKVANAIVCTKYRVERKSSLAEPQPEMFPYSGNIPEFWHDALSLYFNYGGVDAWNHDDFYLHSLPGNCTSVNFVNNFYNRH